MTHDHQAAVRQFCAAWGNGARKEPDKELILSLMDPDAEWTLWVPGGTVQRGHDAISAEIDRQAPMMQFLDCHIRFIASAGPTVVTERTDHFIFMDKPVSFNLVAIFELNDDGKIRAWREYFDTATVVSEMGINPDQI